MDRTMTPSGWNPRRIATAARLAMAGAVLAGTVGCQPATAAPVSSAAVEWCSDHPIEVITEGHVLGLLPPRINGVTEAQVRELAASILRARLAGANASGEEVLKAYAYAWKSDSEAAYDSACKASAPIE